MWSVCYCCHVLITKKEFLSTVVKVFRSFLFHCYLIFCIVDDY